MTSSNSPESAAAQSEVWNRYDQTGLHQPYLIYAEDNESDAIFFQRAFSRSGGELPILRFADGAAVRDFLLLAEREGRPLPRLCILDIKMPGLTGLEVLEMIRKQPYTRHLPVIILSASYEERDVKLAYREQVNAYIVKPNRYRELRELTASIATFWGRFNQPVL